MKSKSLVAVVVGAAVAIAVGFSINSDGITHENRIRVAYFPNIGHAVAITG